MITFWSRFIDIFRDFQWRIELHATIVHCLTMLPGKSYKNVNDLQRKSAKYILHKYFPLVNWYTQDSKNIMDIGCAIGDVTTEILLPELPKNVGLVLGVDKDDAMIKYAKRNFSHEKVNYLVMDISDNVRADLKGNFDCIFSFYCLHWLKDYRKALKNINDYLKPGGLLFTTFLSESDHFFAYDILAAQPKWSNYMKNYEDYLAYYHKHKLPETDFSSQLSSSGFDVQTCEVEKLYYQFESIARMKDFFGALNPIVQNVPEKLHDIYWEEFLEHIRNNDRLPSIIINGKNSAFFRFDTLVAVATKRKCI